MKSVEGNDYCLEKTPNTSLEPWLTIRELFYEAEALQRSYSKWKTLMITKG